ncbi:hypothetical protein SRHO_G00281230 [Serrasalmus rhombeus]
MGLTEATAASTERLILRSAPSFSSLMEQSTLPLFSPLMVQSVSQGVELVPGGEARQRATTTAELPGVDEKTRLTIFRRRGGGRLAFLSQLQAVKLEKSWREARK